MEKKKNEEIIIEDVDYKEVSSKKKKFDIATMFTVRNAIIFIAIIGLLVMGISSYFASNDKGKSNGSNVTDKEEKDDVLVNDSEGLRNVVYYGDWSIWGGQGNFYPKDIAADQITHLNYAFLDFDIDGNLVFTDKDAALSHPVGGEGDWTAGSGGIINAFNTLKAENPNLKTGISVGGWSKSGDFTMVTNNKEARANLVNNLVAFVRYSNMDFVDIDWEYPMQKRSPDKVDNANDEGTPHQICRDKVNYVKFLKDLRKALDEEGKKTGKYYEISVALPASKDKLIKGIDIKEVFKVVDFANIMTYDMRGAWDSTSGHQTNLYSNPDDSLKDNKYSIADTVDYLLGAGVPSDKIVIGSAFYTRGWAKVDAGDNDDLPGLFQKAHKINKDADQTPSFGADNEAPLKLGDSGRVGGVYSYRSMHLIKSKYPNIKEYWDDVAKAPYMYDKESGAFFTYDNERSIAEKCKYVKEKKLGGMIAWMASQDEPMKEGTTRRDKLITAQKEGLFGKAKLPAVKINKTDLDIDATVKVADGDSGKVINITINNNEKLVEKGDALKDLEASYKTIKNAKLEIEVDGATISGGDYQAGSVKQKDNKVTVDLSSVYDAKQIKNGATYSFSLKSSKSDIKVIKKITLLQYSGKDSKAISKQVIYKA